MKTILITGAGRGIGFATAKSLASQNHDLILVTKTKESLLTLKKKFAKAFCIEVDLTNEAKIANLISTIKKKYKKIDVLVNNAGFYIGKHFENIKSSEFDALYKIHMKAPFLLIQKLLPLLEKAKQPQVINISSAANFARIPTESAYTAVKAGLTAMNEVLQKELQKKHIRITNIHPWTVNTHNFDNPQDCLRPEDIGELIYYIVNTHPNCQILNVELSATSDWRGSWPPWFDES